MLLWILELLISSLRHAFIQIQNHARNRRPGRELALVESVLRLEGTHRQQLCRRLFVSAKLNELPGEDFAKHFDLGIARSPRRREAKGVSDSALDRVTAF